MSTSRGRHQILPSSECRLRMTAPGRTPLLSGRSRAITKYRPDFEALAATPTRLVIAVGEESAGTVTDRTSRALAERFGREPAVFPSHHGGFVGGEDGFAGQPEAFARRLREVLEAG